MNRETEKESNEPSEKRQKTDDFQEITSADAAYDKDTQCDEIDANASDVPSTDANHQSIHVQDDQPMARPSNKCQKTVMTVQPPSKNSDEIAAAATVTHNDASVCDTYDDDDDENTEIFYDFNIDALCGDAQNVDVSGDDAPNGNVPNVNAPNGNVPDDVVPAVEQTADILRLNIDCFEEAFDYLMMHDLMSIVKTCKRLNQVVRYIFSQNYSKSGLNWNYERTDYKLRLYHFHDLMYRINISSKDNLDFLLKRQPKLNKLCHIKFYYTRLTEPTLISFSEMLKTVTFLEIFNCDIQADFHEFVLTFCPKIQRISVAWETNNRLESAVIVGTSNDWLRQKYPTLDHFELDKKHLYFGALTAFLELNPNIRNLSINARLLKQNERSLRNLRIKLDNLAILDRNNSTDAEFQQLLKRLHERGFYKRLKYYFTLPQQNQIDLLGPLNVVKFAIFNRYVSYVVNISALTHLEELRVPIVNVIAQWSELPAKLTHLQRIQIDSSTFGEILPFIREAQQLKQIKIVYFGQSFPESDVIDLVTLNKEREKLDGAQKVTIYVDDKIYVATKWAFKETDFNLVRLQRHESVDWDHDFRHLFD